MLSRITRSVASSTRRVNEPPPSALSNKVCTARAAISVSGWRTVVKRGSAPLAQWDVVEAYDTQLLWDPKSGLARGAQDAKAVEVVACEDSSGARPHIEEDLCLLVPGLDPEIARPNKSVIHR